MYYLASPMVNPNMTDDTVNMEEYLHRNDKICKKLEKQGFKIHLPQRDTNQKLSSKKIFATNIEALKNSKAVIVLLSETRGIYLEAGYAKGLGKKIIGLKVDETKALGIIIRNFYTIQSILPKDVVLD